MLSWPGWLTYSGWFTHISGHPSATGWAQDRESSPAKDRCFTAVPRGVTGWRCSLLPNYFGHLFLNPSLLVVIVFQWLIGTVYRPADSINSTPMLLLQLPLKVLWSLLSNSTSKSKTFSCSCSMRCDEASDWSRDSVSSTSRSWSWSSSSHVFTASWNGRSISRLQTFSSQQNWYWYTAFLHNNRVKMRTIADTNFAVAHK